MNDKPFELRIDTSELAVLRQLAYVSAYDTL